MGMDRSVQSSECFADFRCRVAKIGFPLLPEILVRIHQPCCHQSDDLLALVRRNRVGSHLWVFIMLVIKSHHRDQRAAIFLIVDKLTPALVPHVHAAHETASPVIAVEPNLLVLKDERNMDFALVER
jgi:hypothetical protein